MLLSDREWKGFNLISDKTFALCDIKTLKSTSITNYYDKYDVVGATSTNNGNVGFVDDKYVHLLSKGNCICLIKTGQGSVGDAVYKLNDFIPSNNVCIIRSVFLNRYIGSFVVAAINKQADRYSYGYIRNTLRILKEKIMLPISDNGAPDYDFMEAFVKRHEQTKKQEYIAYAKKMVSIMKYRRIEPLEEKEWKEFYVLDLFDYLRGNQNKMNSLDLGDNILVSAKNMDNGLKGFYEKNNKSIYKGHCLSLNNDGDGGVGLSYYQPYEFLLDSHVYALYSKKDISKYVHLFISQSLSKQRLCFNHGRSISKRRLEKIKIMLPANEEGNPDYEHMEQHIKNIMLQKYTDYLKYVKA